MPSHDPKEFSVTPLESFPPMDAWDDWTEYDPAAWPRKVEKRYTLVPTGFSKVPDEAAEQLTEDDLREMLATSVRV